MPAPFDEEDRKFLHDFATPLTVLRMLIKKTRDEVASHEHALLFSKQIERLDKSLKALSDIETIHGDFKVAISSRQAD